MTVRIDDLPDHVIALYQASARAAGVSLDAFLRNHLIQNAPPGSPAKDVLPDEWEKALDACFDGVPETGPLPDEAFQRSSWYR